MVECWDCYDKNFHKVEGKVLVRGQEAAFSDEEYHLVCDVTVKHRDGTYLLTQRDYRKARYPGMWELGAAGSALRGETPEECAKRELLEETGLTADSLREIGRVSIAKNHSHYVVYIASVSCDKSSLILQDGETIAYQWMSRSEVLKIKNELASYRILDMLPELE